jgi:hypothetical protein
LKGAKMKNDISSLSNLVKNFTEAGFFSNIDVEKKLELKNKLLKLAESVGNEFIDFSTENFVDCESISVVCETCENYIDCLDAVNEQYHIISCTATTNKN